MKHCLFIISLFALSLVIYGGTTAKVTGITGNILTIDKGSDQGVEKGMKGKAQRIFIDSTDGERIPLTVGIFIVLKVDKNSSQLEFKEPAVDAKAEMSEQVEFDDILLTLSQKSSQLKTNKEKIIEYIKKESYAFAAELLEETQKLKKGDKELALIDNGLNLLLENEISIKDFIDYKSKRPGPVILNALWKKLVNIPGNQNLPPEKYLDESIPLQKNEKGYYELTFENNRIMIYIPEKKFFIDKFEVSNSLYLPFSNQEGPATKKVKFSLLDLADYPLGRPGYPAVVSFADAQNYCTKMGLRLPTKDQWEEIAGFNKGYNYTWGNEDVIEEKTDGTNIYRANSESLDDGYVELAPVDSFEKYSSPYGVVNMIGNVSEWVIGGYSKGGSFLSETGDLKITGQYSAPIYVGFRCIMEVEK